MYSLDASSGVSARVDTGVNKIGHRGGRFFKRGERQISVLTHLLVSESRTSTRNSLSPSWQVAVRTSQVYCSRNSSSKVQEQKESDFSVRPLGKILDKILDKRLDKRLDKTLPSSFSHYCSQADGSENIVQTLHGHIGRFKNKKSQLEKKRALLKKEIEQIDQNIEQISTDQNSANLQIASSLLATKPFGPAQWEKYYGRVGKVPLLNGEIHTILEKKCVLVKDSIVGQSHSLFLMPETIDDHFFTFALLNICSHNPRGGGVSQACSCEYKITQQLGEWYSSPHWFLITNEIVCGTLSQSYEQHLAFIKDYEGSVAGFSYRLPTFLEAATSLLVGAVSTGQRWGEKNRFTYCIEKADVNHKLPVAVGINDEGQIEVLSNCDEKNIGIRLVLDVTGKTAKF